jgi:sensor c-di-GMP phosphodiesterase-like protein
LAERRVVKLSRKYLLATLVGVLLAGLPMSIFNFWLDDIIERQGQDEVEVSARRTMVLAENRITRVVQGLEDLAERGVASCSPADIERLRREAFAASPIKELSVVGPDGQMLCTDIGVQLGHRKILSSQPIMPSSEFWLEVARIGTPARLMVQIRRQAPGAAGLAALVPTELFVPQVSTQGGPVTYFARMMLRDGTVVGQSGVPPEQSADAQNAFVKQLESSRYGLKVQVVLPRALVAAGRLDLHTLGLIVTGGIALIISLFALIMPLRQRETPISEIERALKADEFIPYYQPIVDITTGRLLGVEVLVRWRKPDGSVVGPGHFIPLAESSGLILELTRVVMRKACAEIGAEVGRRPHFKVGFNLVARHFSDEKILSDVGDIFGDGPIRLSQVVLEVTERQPLANLTAARRVIAALQGIGVRVAIDDVGTGHSGLSYLLKLGVDIIKIDKMFVDAISTDGNSATIVETLVDLARNMRMEIIAEGVENFNQVISLRDRGIHAAQGFVFAPPLPAASILQLLAAIDPRPVATTHPEFGSLQLSAA